MNLSKDAPPLPPLLVLVVGILAVSTASIFIRYAQEYTSSLVIAAYRLVIATLLLAPIALTRKRAELRALSASDLRLALISGVFLALHFAAWISSLEYTTVASSVVLVTTAPLWVALLSPLALKEPLTRPILTGLGLALIGGVTVGLSDTCRLSAAGLACPSWSEFLSGEAFLGDLLALVGAIMAAGYFILGRRLRVGMSLVTYIFVVYGMAGVMLTALVLVSGGALWGYPPITYGWFLLLALVPQLIGHSSFNYALAYLSAAYVSITQLGEPIGSTILAYFLLAESPTVIKLFGAILILAGIFIATRSEVRETAPVSPIET